MNDATLKSEQDHAYSKIRAVCLFPYLMTIIFWILNSEIKWLKKFSHLKQKLEEAYRDGRVRYSIRYSVICKITVRYYVTVTGYWLHIVNECVSECFTLTTALHKRCKLLKHYIFQSFFVPHSQSCVQLSDPWTAVCQSSLSSTIARSLLKLMSIESRCHPIISSFLFRTPIESMIN